MKPNQTNNFEQVLCARLQFGEGFGAKIIITNRV